MKKFGIIGAMDSEIVAFCRDFGAVETKFSGILCGKCGESEIYICRSGVGKVNAAIAAQRLIDLCGVEYVINSGVAGGVGKNIAKLDIVISQRLAYHDFSPLELLDKYPPYESVMTADKELCNKAVIACERLNKSLADSGKPAFTAHMGTVVSGDCFVSSSEKVAQLRADFDALCTEMEGAAIAHVCKVNSVPFVIIRAISDFADEDAENSFESFETVAADRAAFIVKEIIMQ